MSIFAQPVQQEENVIEVHSLDHPYCSKPTCPYCHTDLEHHERVTEPLAWDVDSELYTASLQILSGGAR